MVATLILYYGGSTSYGDDRPKKAKVSDIHWLRFDEGVKLAAKDKKPVVIDFYTDWCGWCKKMDKETYYDTAVVNFASRHLVMVKVNAESEERFGFKGTTYSGRQLARYFEVEGFPTTVFLHADGETITAIPGYQPPEQFLPILRYIQGGWYEKMDFEQFLKRQN